MTEQGDLETRLTATLGRRAEHAPGADGLAAASRRRSRVRRRRAVVGGAVAVVLLVVAPLGVGGLLRGDGRDPDRAADGGGWRTVEVTLPEASGDPRVVLVDVPGSWVELPAEEDCVADVEYAPEGTPACAEGEGLSLVTDPAYLARPGLRTASEVEDDGGEATTAWTGVVSLDGDGVAVVRSDDEQQVLRTLGSVRDPGQDGPSARTPWALEAASGVAYRVPLDRRGLEVRVSTRPGAVDELTVESTDDGRWRVVRGLEGLDRRITVVAPTQALAEVVAGSARPAVDAPVRWTTLTVRDVDVDVPADWDLLRSPDCEVDDSAFGPPGTDPCAGPYPLLVGDGRLVDPADPPGLASPRGGFVITGDAVVAVDVADRATARRVLASVRPRGEPVPDLARWRRVDAADGLTAEVPVGGGIGVRRALTEQACGPPSRGSAGRMLGVDGRWQVSLCLGGFVYVDAPTRALADVVASTIPLE